MHDLSLRLIGRLARKELREILRDRRTIVTLVLMPVLVYPLLFIAFREYFRGVQKPATATVFRIGMPPEQEDIKQFMSQLELGAPENDPTSKSEFSFFQSDDLEADVRSESIELGVRLRSLSRDTAEWEILVRADSPLGKKAFARVQTRLLLANVRIMQKQIRQRGGPAAMPIQATVTELSVSEAKEPSVFATLVPLILVLMTITGAVYPAIDLTAGERERGTLELLMAAPVPRIALLLAKYFAVLVVAVLTGLVNLTSMTVTVMAGGLGQLIFGDAGLSAGTIAAVLALLLLFAAFFSAVLLAVTSFARSFKEAQAYLIPLMLLSISPGILSLLPNVRLSGLLSVTPLINVVLLTREIFEGTAQVGQAVIVVVSTVFYAFTAIAVAARLFGAEAVLFSEQGQWSDLLRRPREPRPVASLSAALFCLAVMFPAHFVLSGFLSRQMENLGVRIDVRLAVSIAESVILFVGIPMLSGLFSRVTVASGFQFRRASPWAFLGAILLGLSLWPFVSELILVLNRAGLTTTSDELQKAAQAYFEKLRGAPIATLLALAVAPAIVEEMFFRGYLFNALSASARPRGVIAISAIMFGAFHLLVGETFAIERLLPSTLMGLVLGWVRWRSGSVFPGMLLHAAHNCILVSVGLYPGAFGPLSLAMEGVGHVPAIWLGSGAIGAAVGTALIWIVRSSNHFLPKSR
jgi:ABC-2 type transport system permease protein/sodium transport system permease protein